MKKLIKRLPLVWIILGIILFCYGIYGYFLLLHGGEYTRDIQHSIEKYEQVQTEIDKINKQANFDESSIKPVAANEYAQAQLQAAELIDQRGIGTIYIPSANIQTQILAGMANYNLIVGVGTYRENQKLGTGNYVVLAHNMVQGGGKLDDLNKTSVGSKIYATDFSKVYEYKATINKIENQANGELLNEPLEEDSSKITLFRCEGGLNTPNRAVVQGNFIKSYPATEASKEVLSGLGLLKKTAKEDNLQSLNEKTTQVNSKRESEQTGNTEDIVEQSKKSLETGKKGSREKKNIQVYNQFQKGAIRLFQFINQNGFVTVMIYFLVLIVLFLVNIRL